MWLAKFLNNIIKIAVLLNSSFLYSQFQFNYNDIIPIKKNLNKSEPSENNILKKIKKNTYYFRYKYLNRSVFFQVLILHLGKPTYRI